MAERSKASAARPANGLLPHTNPPKRGFSFFGDDMTNCTNCPGQDRYKPAEAVHLIAEPQGQPYAAWRISYQSSEQAARAAYACMQELGAELAANKAAPAAQAVEQERAAFESLSKSMACEWNLDWDAAGFYSDVKADSAFTWFQHGYQRALRATPPAPVAGEVLDE